MKRTRIYHLFLILLGLVLLAYWFISSAERVEVYYSRGLFLYIAQFLRISFGWSSISIGDILYCSVICLLIYWLYWLIRNWSKAPQKRAFIISGILKSINIFLSIWLLFNIMWGFNYYRQNIGYQFSIKNKKPYEDELRQLAIFLLEETNRYAPGRDNKSFSLQSSRKTIQLAYDSLANKYPFLKYKSPSFKPSLFGELGNYMGYGGYYNPFSGEAHINDRQLVFVLPFTGAHEVAHQLGYAKESEANFIGYLASLHSSDSSLRYSGSLEMFLYTNNALFRKDSMAAKQNADCLSPIAKTDIKAHREFLKKYQGPIDELTTAFYTRFLKVNNQPEGMGSYGRVVGWLWNYLNSTDHIKKRLN